MKDPTMHLWLQWYSVVAPVRPACSRKRTFVWRLCALAGMCARGDLLGVSSIVRTLGLAARCYPIFLNWTDKTVIFGG